MEKQDIKTNPNLVDALGYYIKNRRLQKKIGLREMADKLNILTIFHISSFSIISYPKNLFKLIFY